jgi:hypothetical protein
MAFNNYGNKGNNNQGNLPGGPKGGQGGQGGSNSPTYIDPKEFETAKQVAAKSRDTYVHRFSSPFTYQGKEYKELTFDWGKLTGKDHMDIIDECMMHGKAVILPSHSVHFLIRMAALACTEPIGSDAFPLMPMPDFNRITSAARSFLLRTES